MENSIEQKFTDCYKANTDALFRHILFRLGGDRERAKELLQETFCRAWGALAKKQASGKEVDNLRAYFYRIAHNLLVDEYGKPKTSSLEALAEARSDDGEAGEIEIRDMGVHADTLMSVESAELARAMAKLPDDYRQVLAMRYIDDLGPSAIAEVTGESANVISVRINRATEALRKILNIEQ